MKVIMNGDDLGYTMANTLGIIEAYQKGILRSTTALTNSQYILQAAELTKDLSGLGIGVHLTLTLGKPLTENQTLHDENGLFYPGSKTIWQMNPDYEEIYNEFKAQIEKFIEVFGKMPTHLDSHHNVHCATPQALEITQRLADEYHLPMRGYNDYVFVPDFYGENATVENLKQIFIEHKHEDIEVMCHPGFCDLELYRNSSYNIQRLNELDILCNEELRKWSQENNIAFVHY